MHDWCLDGDVGVCCGWEGRERCEDCLFVVLSESKDNSMSIKPTRYKRGTYASRCCQLKARTLCYIAFSVFDNHGLSPI